MKQIVNNTYFIKGGTNTGVYTYGNNAITSYFITIN